jgi:asparagine synthase (glutamine-hydrolysing)
VCGVVGFWSNTLGTRDELAGRARAMAQALAHRGPDDSDTWVDETLGIAFGHRRLSIVDLSAEGRQPMRSHDGRWVICFNGEIYNFQALRRTLDQTGATRAWRGHSDTEILLEAIVQWGVEGAIERSVGMFAFALWDRAERTLTLARDRMGEKPLYYGFAGGTLLFGSELKGLRAHPDWAGEIDRDALAEFMQYSCIPVPRSIYRGIHKLPAGTTLTLRASDLRARQTPAPRAYWRLIDVIERARANPGPTNEAEAATLLETQLRESIANQMVADVPLGAFLSGGIDSSTTVALMQSLSSRPIRTFSIGFTEQDYNEATYAAAVAKHLGTHHTELYVTPGEALAIIPALPQIFDEPFADSSQIPTLLVSDLARRYVTVSLSGDGGDELFGGYSRYFWAEQLERRFARGPASVRTASSKLLRALPTSAWDRVFALLRPMLPQHLRVEMAGDKVHKYAAFVGATSERELYDRLISMWYAPTLVLGGRTSPPDDPMPTAPITLGERLMVRDSLMYLPDDILAKVDRTAMSVSLETRIPFLDHRVVELAWAMPAALKMNGGVGKRVLRSILHRYVPPELVERPKMGFTIPLDQWLRGPLHEWAQALLDPVRIRREGFLDPVPIERAWNEHQRGTRNWPHRLWNVLMFQAWLESVGPKP